MKVTVHIERRPEIADPEGTTISRSLVDLGYDEVVSVRTGRTLHLEVEGDDADAVKERVDEMCQRLLANPVIEDYRIEVEA
ncbi:MAG: phosphoribosylformylglycinamidine synthase subunit PurS [Actinomycetes bacterium]|nr:phosphoribosylformylglycinamidine synthase subunit PurS [Acidimicrobiia bacterium]